MLFWLLVSKYLQFIITGHIYHGEGGKGVSFVNSLTPAEAAIGVGALPGGSASALWSYPGVYSRIDRLGPVWYPPPYDITTGVSSGPLATGVGYSGSPYSECK